MEIKDLLPVGSVVLLKGTKKRMMVFGVKQLDKTTDKEYDYIGVFYPEGFVGKNGQYLFNHEDIEQIYFRGYEDRERAGFLQALDNFYKKQEAEKNQDAEKNQEA
jgi:hypothetical protein